MGSHASWATICLVSVSQDLMRPWPYPLTNKWPQTCSKHTPATSPLLGQRPYRTRRKCSRSGSFYRGIPIARRSRGGRGRRISVDLLPALPAHREMAGEFLFIKSCATSKKRNQKNNSIGPIRRLIANARLLLTARRNRIATNSPMMITFLATPLLNPQNLSRAGLVIKHAER